MPIDLYEELIEETEEEQAILESNQTVEKKLYTDQADFIVESEKFLGSDRMIMIRKHTRFIDFPKHRHNYIEVNYVYNGELSQKVGEETITLKKGEFLFLNQYIDHELKACRREDIIINFIIQPRFFEYIFSYLTTETTESNIGSFLVNSLYTDTQNGQFLYFAVAEVPEIQELAGKIIMEIMEPSLFSQASIKLYMGLLMIELAKHSDKVKKQNKKFTQHHLIMESLRYIEEEFQEASLTELAERLYQTPYGLSKKIKKVTSYTFKELLQERRLREAKELLEKTDMPISSIVEQAGYDNISYFYGIFKNKYGQTPKNYRQQLSLKN